MKTQRDAIAAALGLVLGVTSMAGMLSTDLYVQAAGAEARGEQALIQSLAPQYCDAARAARRSWLPRRPACEPGRTP